MQSEGNQVDTEGFERKALWIIFAWIDIVKCKDRLYFFKQAGYPDGEISVNSTRQVLSWYVCVCGCPFHNPDVSMALKNLQS